MNQWLYWQNGRRVDFMIQTKTCINVYSDMNTWIDFCIVIGAYEDFTKDEEIEFLNKIVKYQNERIKVKQKEIGCIIEERDLVIDLIKEKER